MERFEDLARAAGMYVPEQPPMVSPPVLHVTGVECEYKDQGLANLQVPISGLT